MQDSWSRTGQRRNSNADLKGHNHERFEGVTMKRRHDVAEDWPSDYCCEVRSSILYGLQASVL